MMLVSISLNPLTWVRWIFLGKALSEIVADFEKKKDELESFFTRTERRVASKAAQITALQAQNLVHSAEMQKAKMVADNLKLLMSQTLAPQAEESHNNEG